MSSMRKLTKEEANQWVDALKSGDYKQGYFEFHDYKDDSYCCLGVLCNVLKFKSESSTMISTRGKQGSWDYPLLSEEDQNKFIHMNDSKSKSFPEIAEAIVEHFELDEPEETRPQVGT